MPVPLAMFGLAARLRRMLDGSRSVELAAVLEWYREMGVDQAVEDQPVDWLARGDAPPGGDLQPVAPPADDRKQAPNPTPAGDAPARPAGPAPTRQFPTAAPDAAVHSARAAARDAASLDELGATLARFDGCSLKATAKNLCFYRGAAQSRIMLIGEAPGRDEDIEGKPFVGRAGQLLDKMLSAIQLGEQDVHITNIVYWRPPGNRTPTPQEAQVCRPFLERQVELVAPEVIVLLGGAAAKHILDVAEGIMKVRGKWRDLEIGAHKTRALATLHPAYLLRTPAAKRLAWRDLLTIRAVLTG
jgi:uracil-DNA glycosylase family 4